MKFSDQVVDALRDMHPGVRRDIRRALDAADAGKPCDIKPLQTPLEGYWRLRIGRHRVILRYHKGGLIAEYLAPRSIIYEVFTSPRQMLED
jgi:mRNA interferase RelE/StbE